MPYSIPSNAIGSAGQCQLYTQAVVAPIANASSFVKGAWVQVDAAVPAGIQGVLISGGFMDSADTAWVIDIGIGPASSEVVICANIPVEWGIGLDITGLPMMLPIRIPEGARVSVRVARQTAGAVAINLEVGLYTGACGPVTYDYCENVAGSARGVLITGTGYFTIDASVARNWKGFIVTFGADGGSQTDSQQIPSMAVGDAGNEVDIWLSHARMMTDGDMGPMPTTWHNVHPYSFQIGSEIRVLYGVANTVAANLIYFI